MLSLDSQYQPSNSKASPYLLLKQRSEGTLSIFCCCRQENIQDLEIAPKTEPKLYKISIRSLKRKRSESDQQNQSHSKSKSKKTTNTNKISIKTLKKNMSKSDLDDSSYHLPSKSGFQSPKNILQSSCPQKKINRKVNNIQTNNIIVGKCIIEVDNGQVIHQNNDKDNSNIEEEFNNIFGDNKQDKTIEMPIDLHGLTLFQKNKTNQPQKADFSPMANFSFGHRQINFLKEKYMSFPTLPMKESKNQASSDNQKKSQRWSQGSAMSKQEPSLQVSHHQPSIQEELKVIQHEKSKQFVRSPLKEQYLNKLGGHRIYKSQSEQSRQSLVIETYSSIANRKINLHKIKALA